MLTLIGEYDCKVDAKNRLLFPSDLKKQMGNAFDRGFVINRNLHHQCLTLYPMQEWEVLNEQLRKLNRLIKANDIFIRKFMGGATICMPDSAGRILIPKPLSEYAQIKSDIKVIGSNNIIEIWDKDLYNNFLNQDFDIEKMALEIFGNNQEK
ncbi:MAG: division/cell wall cluster transcriptional repressor MraZ [Bacteroidia bacterium]|jgi:MraZ protein|nr:division/cell wall cluster transcriptional repressor MraZ [Bacteroidia bacterium]